MLELLSTISLRHLVLSPVRSLLVLFGISLGVATVAATSAVNRSILGSFHEMVDRVAGKVDLLVTGGEVGVPAELIDELRELEGVAHVAGSLEIVSRRPQGRDGPLLILGVDFLGDRHFLPMTIESGEDVLEDPVSVVNDPSAILVSRSFAAEAKSSVGSTVELLTPDGPRPFTVRGILEDEGLAASFGGRVALMFTEAAQLAFARGDRVDRIDIAIAEGARLEDVEARVLGQVRERGRVERPESKTEHLESIIQPITRALYIAGALALLVGMFLIYNAVGVAVAQRQREIGILRAIGVTRRTVVALFCIEALILATLGGALGLVLGLGLAKLALAQSAPTISRFYAAIRPAPPEITLDLAAVAFTLGLLATLFAAYWPASQAAKVDPVEPLRRATRRLTGARIPHRGLLVAGALLLIPAAITSQFETVGTSFGSMFLILGAGILAVPSLILSLRRLVAPAVERLVGITGRIAIDNAERSLGRSALTIAALMTSVTSSVSVASWGLSLQHSIWAWLDHSLPADLYITSGSFIADQHNVPFRPEVMDKLTGIEGVRQMYPVRMTSLDVARKRVQLITVDMKIYHDELERKHLAGKTPVQGPSVIDPKVLQETPSLVLGENAARKLGKNAGDELILETPSGKRAFRVYAVVVDYTSDQGTCLLDRRWYLEYWQDHLVDTVDIFLADGAAHEAVAAEVRRRLGGGESLFVVTATDVREEIRAVIHQSLAIFDSTDLLALMVALLGVIGTMFAAVLDRVRELGVLRAIGATTRQIVTGVVVEAAFLGFSAAAAGVLTGIPMGYVFVRVVGLVGTGWQVDYLFPWAAALRVASLVIVTAALAGLLPGRRAARMSVPEALAYE